MTTNISTLIPENTNNFDLFNHTTASDMYLQASIDFDKGDFSLYQELSYSPDDFPNEAARTYYNTFRHLVTARRFEV